jgi:hypothetical protein
LTAWQQHRRWLISQVVLWVAVVVALRVAVVPAESCPPVALGDIDRALAAGGAWLARGQDADGRFRYGYDSETGQLSAEYNTTRHAGVMDALYRLGRIRAADRGLLYARENLIHADDWTAFAPPGEQANAGVNALLVVALVHRRERTGETRYDGLIERLARFLVAQEQGDGSVLQFWDPVTRRPVEGLYGKFSTGEAFYALALVGRIEPGEVWDATAHRIGAYLATRRDRAEGYSLREPDHWAAYGLDALAPAGLTETEVEYGRWLAGYFGWLIRLESQRRGRILNPFIESGAELGTIGEASAALWRLSGTDPRMADLRVDLGERIECMAGVLVARQTPRDDPDPRARGAWFADGYTQMDDQQHALAALLGAREVIRAEAAR